MSFKPTPSQGDAIKAQGCVLVSAAAGSGKTAVLVERVIKMLTDRENPVFANRLLIVTFTNAAAAEMLSRIEARLYDELKNNPGDELINRQIYLIKSADICTIDSFCIRLVRDNFALCGIEPDFKVTDDTSLYPVRREVLTDIVSEYIDNCDTPFLRLLDLADCRLGEENLLDLIDGIYTYSLKKPFPARYVNLLKAPYFQEFGAGHPWYEYSFSLVKSIINDMENDVSNLAEAALYCENHDKATVHAEAISSIVSGIKNAFDSHEWDILFDVLRSSDIGSSPKNCGDDFKRYKTEIKAGISKAANFFSNSKNDVAKEIEYFAPAVELLCEIIGKYSERLFERLKKDNTFSFDDVEQMAMSMLLSSGENGVVISEQAKELIARYDQVLVDEFQDVNDLQNTLFEVLSGDSEKLFIVGDVKQSIYAFRGSNPDIFLNKKDAYTDYLNSAADGRKRIILSDNFRSRKGICESVNYFFEKIMTKQAGGLVYNDAEMLNYHAGFPENNTVDTDFYVIDKVDDDSDDSVVESEAAAICSYIKKVMSSGKVLRDSDGNLRPAEYGDFCILLAALKEKSGVIADKLNACGIPAKVNDGSFFDSTEIVTALSLLRVINNPNSDIDLLRTLMSPVFGFTAEEMAKIRIAGKKMSLYSALVEYSKENIKAQNFLSLIIKLRNMSCMLPVNKFVGYVIDKTDMMNIFCAMTDGDIRSDHLMRFMHYADEYSGSFGGSVYGFIKFIESIPEKAVKIAGSADGQCVKIMSIHGSKGLQFPVCVVAGLSYAINKLDAREGCMFSGEYGLGFKYYDRANTDKKENLCHKILVEEELIKTAQERLRLLYVAMTRAEEKLCLLCCLKNAKNTLVSAALASNRGQSEIEGRYIKYANNSAQYILAAAIMHPDADILRRTAEISVKTADTESKIAFSFINAQNGGADFEKKEEAPEINRELADKILENTKKPYPFEELTHIPAKVSVSALANKAEAESFAMSERPAFMEKDGLSAAGRGTAAHKIMQFIEFNGIPDVDGEIARLYKQNRITESEANAVDRAVLKRFFESDIYRRILKSDTVKREMRFLTELPAAYYGAAGGTDQKFIVQGAVDLCFAEEDGVVVLDFKTDRVDDLSQLKEKYSRQLEIYAVACEKIFNLPVKEKIIYSFALSDWISIAR